jgi:hypothetical protein
MSVKIRASEGDDALDYTITDHRGTILWKDSFLPDHIEFSGYSEEFFIRKGDMGMKVDALVPMSYVKSSFETLRERAYVPSSQWMESTIQNQNSIEQIYGMSYSDYQRVVISAHKAKVSTKDIRDMSVAEYASYRRSVLGPEEHTPLGVSTNIGPIFGTDYNTHPKSSFELWKEAREQYIKGEIDDIELVLRYVREEEPGYSKIVDMEIAEERKSKEVDSGVHKHRFNWRRWPTWRWLVPWLHR